MLLSVSHVLIASNGAARIGVEGYVSNTRIRSCETLQGRVVLAWGLVRRGKEFSCLR